MNMQGIWMEPAHRGSLDGPESISIIISSCRSLFQSESFSRLIKNGTIPNGCLLRQCRIIEPMQGHTGKACTPWKLNSSEDSLSLLECMLSKGCLCSAL